MYTFSIDQLNQVLICKLQILVLVKCYAKIADLLTTYILHSDSISRPFVPVNSQVPTYSK